MESRSLFEFSEFDGLKDYLKRLALLPLTLFRKTYKTFFRIAGVLIMAVLVLVTLGASQSLRAYFVGRVTSLAEDLADWILLPFAVLSCVFRLIFSVAKLF